MATSPTTAAELIGELTGAGLNYADIGRALDRNRSLVRQVAIGAKPGHNLTDALGALRERVGDIPLLVEAFLDEAATRSGGHRLHLRSDTLRALGRYTWPGNVRELRAEVQRWTVFCEEEVRMAELSPEIRSAIAGTAPSAKTPRGEVESSPRSPVAQSLATVVQAPIWA